MKLLLLIKVKININLNSLYLIFNIKRKKDERIVYILHQLQEK